ncbi:hypothetical protein [Pseudomonas aeruginosa]|uniref:hypothetical protein n=1 Tax=Pseudomonas aeruginosa TaxID=287 RepID=UPI002A6AF6C7|nr:hypothetical protein [Pseudomonas aeruginosa]MDY1511944.1 hypothetical protein [Pseudomonas aeruginosa]
MSNCPHEAWDFGALQCPDCSAVKDHVTDAEYAKLAAEAQALREEVAALRITRDDFKLERDLARKNFCDEQAANYQLQAHLKACLGELSELRARVVVTPALRDVSASVDPEYRASATGYNLACADMESLNGLTVSEGLLRLALEFIMATNCQGSTPLWLIEELRALLNRGKENGNG